MCSWIVCLIQRRAICCRAFLDEALDVLAEHFGISERGEMRFLREAVGRMVAEQEAFDTRIEVMAKKVDSGAG